MAWGDFVFKSYYWAIALIDNVSTLLLSANQFLEL